MNPTRQKDVLDATEHLPPSATLVIHEFGWDDYEKLLVALNERRCFRVNYDCGRLEVLSLSPSHEEYAWFIDLLVFVFCEIRDLNIRCFGGATWKRKALLKGVEADTCYYTRNSDLIRGRSEINIEVDPPPDIAVEIDITNSSLRKLPIYAALSIPEVWRYDGKLLQFLSLADGVYSEIDESCYIPGLTCSMLVEALEAGKSNEPMEVLKAFRRRIQKL
jgi:Uma2 family endonuclease